MTRRGAAHAVALSVALVVVMSLLSTTAYARAPEQLTSPRVALAATTTSRWVNVAVGTLWVTRDSARPIDRAAVSPPGSVGAWIAAMSLQDKRLLVGRIETQALYATPVTVLSSSAGWSRVVVPSQPTPRDRRGYPGWIPTWELTSRAPVTSASVAVVTARLTWIQSSPASSTAGRLMEVTYDTRLPVVAVVGRYVEVSLLSGRRGYVLAASVSVLPRGSARAVTGARVLAEARKFLGLQYLWGGTSGFGYDCSGFTYSVFHVLGITIPRDAAPQSTRGRSIARSNLRPGDLVFFRDNSGVVVHVAIFYGLVRGVPSVIHSPGTGLPVSITPLSAWSSASYAGARRDVSS